MERDDRKREREPRSPEEARRAIGHARNRIARDLDAIEHRVRRQRRRVVGKADALRTQAERLEGVRHRLRSRPLLSLGLALGAGVLMGAITGGGEDGT